MIGNTGRGDLALFVESYKKLIVWQKAVELVVEIYEITEKFPKTETYGLTSQIRRSAVSVPSNIAEGQYRRTGKDYIQFLRIAFGSGAEIETQLIIAKKLPQMKTLDYSRADSLLEEVMKMLNALISSISP